MAFAGFDSLAYPGDAMMQWLKSNTNFSFVGFYLAPAPSRPTSGWMGKRDVLIGQGWGLGPLYVGQQEPGQPGSHDLTAAQGKLDGLDAVHLMSLAGFPQGTVIYLDCEQGGAASSAVKAYVGAWVDNVSGYTAGIYCSHTTAASLLAIRPNVKIWTWNIKQPAPGPNFPAPAPSGSGVPQATVWQYYQNTNTTFHGAPVPTLKIDLDSASVADPSQSSASMAAVLVAGASPVARKAAAKPPKAGKGKAPAKKASPKPAKKAAAAKRPAKKQARKASKTSKAPKKTKAKKNKASKKN
jgi:hypothetical protein